VKKNIILLITDTFRYDNLGDNGAKTIRTPALDSFAAERATSIENFYTGSFPTIPHRTDLASGTVGWPHYGWQPIAQSGPNHIGRILGDAGYTTQLICDCPHLFNSGFQHGFDAAFQHRGQEGDMYLLHHNDPIKRAVPKNKTRLHPSYKGATLADQHRWINREPRYETEAFPPKTAETSVRWLEENCEAGPFFLWVDFFDPHEPWDAPEYMVKRYQPRYEGKPMIHPNYGLASAYTAAELKNLWAHYAAEAELADRWIGRILQKVDDLQLWDDTIVAVTSDHGISIGEHNRTAKMNISKDDPRYWPIYPEVGHVPFMLAGGDVPRGASLDLIAQPVDILPTLCDLARVKVKPPRKFDGSSFAAPVRAGEGPHRDYAVSGSNITSPEGVRPRGATTPFVTTEKWGYAPVGATGRPELYNLRNDPLAEKDVASRYPGVVKKMHSMFIDHLCQHGADDALMAMWEDPADSAEGSWAIDYR
jgi:arylsulfatase A-like enzyme